MPAVTLTLCCCLLRCDTAGQGENIAQGHRSWAEVAREWYNQVAQYNFGTPVVGRSTSQFTQMVWKGTRQLGCASARSQCNSKTIYVCRYFPAGNVQGSYRANVFPATP
ncbi:CAP domain-containing protein [Haematococcus lacustris]